MKKERPPKGERRTLREKMANSFDVSREVILDVPKITFIGNRELTVENYQSVAEYTGSRIVLMAKPHRLEICGIELEIKSLARELLYITGRVSSLDFKKEV